MATRTETQTRWFALGFVALDKLNGGHAERRHTAMLTENIERLRRMNEEEALPTWW